MSLLTPEQIYKYRFTFYIISQISILFGSLLFPEDIFYETLLPWFLVINILIGIVVVSKQKFIIIFYAIIFILSISMYGFSIYRPDNSSTNFIRLILYSLFYIPITIDIIKQVWLTKKVDSNTIIGLMSGYIALGLMSFFMFSAIEHFNAGSFSGLVLTGEAATSKVNSILYFSYVTLMTIGYGDIMPVTEIAQKASILCALIGQFYIVIVTALIVGKYLNQYNHK